MSGSIVNVLTPNGRRQNVKVQPNTALLKVLEDVCEKHKFDPNEHDLKHHKRILDLTTSFRFSGLPNNAQLEMVEAQKKRQDVEVELVIQLPDGTRLDGKFKPNVTLLEIIQQLCPNELTGTDLFAIYMRTEVASDKLGNTSLKDLGLVSGRAMIRLVHRDPNAAKIQANVALNLQAKQPKDDEVKQETSDNRENKIRKTDDFTTKPAQSLIQVLKEERKKEELASNMAENLQQSNESEPNQTVDDSAQSSGSGRIEDEQMIVSPSEPTVEMELDEEDEDTGEIHILGERSAVLFTQDAAKKGSLSDLPDTFFDLSVSDLKLLIKDLRTLAEGTVEQPLMTAKLREMEEEQKQLSMLNRYKAAIIRIQFPNRYVLQGTFTPYETIDMVISFVRSYLSNPDIDFYLYTTPPKTILSKESRLFEANCVPSAVLHFGCEEKVTNYLKEDILDKISSPKASLMQALSDRGIKQQSSGVLSSEDQPSTSQQARRSNVSSNFSTSKASSSIDAKLPKWFKPIGK